jgi:hypothetical protein
MRNHDPANRRTIMAKKTGTKAAKGTKAPKATKVKAAKVKAEEAPVKAETPVTAPKKVSALDAAHRVLAAAGAPMTAKELIAAMAAQGLWNSPKGKTPANTLYAAVMREINTKGDESRFSRPEPGKFTSR